MFQGRRQATFWEATFEELWVFESREVPLLRSRGQEGALMGAVSVIDMVVMFTWNLLMRSLSQYI